MNEKINAHLQEKLPVDEEKESKLKKELLDKLTSAQTLTDLAFVKRRSLAFDERASNREEVHKAILRRFETLLVDEVNKLPKNHNKE